MTIPLFCLALCAVCKSVTQEVNAGAKLLSSQLRSCGTLQALQRTERSQTACHSWIHPLTKKKKSLHTQNKARDPSWVCTQTHAHKHTIMQCQSVVFQVTLQHAEIQLFRPCVSASAVTHISSIWSVLNWSRRGLEFKCLSDFPNRFSVLCFSYLLSC